MQDVSCAGYIGSWDCQRARCFKHQIHLASLESKRHGSTPTKPGWKFLYQRFTRNCWNHVRYMSSIPGAMCQLAWLHYRGYIKIHEDVQEGIEGFPIALQILSWIFLAMNRGGMKMMKAISLYRYIQLFMKQWMLIESQSHQRGSMSCQMWDPWRAGGASESSCADGNTQWCCLCVYAAIAQLAMWSCCSFKAMFFSIWSNGHDARKPNGIIPIWYILWLDLISIQFWIFEESCAQSRSTFIANWSPNKKLPPTLRVYQNEYDVFIAMETSTGIQQGLIFVSLLKFHATS